MGGLGEHVRELSKKLIEINDDLVIDILEPTFSEPWELIPGRVQVYGIKPTVGSVTPMHWDCYESIFRLQAVILQALYKIPNKPDLIHAQDWSMSDAVRIFRDEQDVPLVTTIHLGLEDMVVYDASRSHYYYPKAMRAMQDMQNSIVENSNAVCHVSQHYAKRFGSIMCADRETIIGNGIDLSPWMQPLDRPFEFPGKRPKKLVYIGRFAIMKNIHSLLNAKLPDDVDLCIVGCEKGSDKEVREMVYAHASYRDDLHLLGPLYGTDKIRCMKSAWAGVFPSLREPFGIVGLEWMAARRPMIASYVDGMNDFLEPGMALQTGTTAMDISTSIHKLREFSEGEISTMTDAAWRRVQLFSWRTVAQRVLEAYDKARNRTWIERSYEKVMESCRAVSRPGVPDLTP